MKHNEPYKSLYPEMSRKLETDRDYLSVENIIKRHKSWHKSLMKKRISEYNKKYYLAHKSDDFPHDRSLD